MKILLVQQTPWDPRLGMSKVHHDLKLAFENMGHEVDYLDQNRLYPKGTNFYNQAVGKKTQGRIYDFLKKHSNEYDIIDANQRCIPYSKEELGFKGLLVFRSHGLPPLYTISENTALYKRMTTASLNVKSVSFKTRLGNFRRYLTKAEGEWALWGSIRSADVVHTLNQAEYDYLKEYGVPLDRLVLVPNGMDDGYIADGAALLNDHSVRNEISFIGSWTMRKGIVHLPEVLDSVSDIVERVNLLGTGGAAATVINSFPQIHQHKLKVHPHFDASALPGLLKSTKVGIFPSYVEGFGLAVIEHLALGIPVVAFDTPGPADILKPIDSSLVVKIGDIAAFNDKVREILSLSDEAYNHLRQACHNRALDFKNSLIACRFLDIYSQKFKDLGT